VIAVISLLGYCAFLASQMLPAWIEIWTEPRPSLSGTLLQGVGLRAQVIPCLVLAGLALIPRLTELAIAIAAFIVLSFGVVVALVEPWWGLPPIATGTLLIVALAIGRWPRVDRV
jgi:hypothetical protein